MASPHTLKEGERPWMHGAAGVLGGSLAMMAFYPLDFLRTRMHTLHQGSRTMPLRSAGEIVRQEGLRGMYRGIAVSVVSHSFGWGAYLLTFRSAQDRIEKLMERHDAKVRELAGNTQRSFTFDRYVGSSSRDFMAACVAATITGTMITPLHVIKTRRQLCDHTHGKTASDSFWGIIRNEGWRAMFRGLGPQILLTGNTTVQVTIYEWFRRNAFTNHDDPSSFEVAVASAFSKAVACVLFNPLEVVRTRLQDRRNHLSTEYSSMTSGLQTIWRTEGFAGMYRGLPVNVLRVIPSTVAAFVLYEKCLWLIRTSHMAVVNGSLHATVSRGGRRSVKEGEELPGHSAI